MAKFLIADDHPLFREALSAALAPFFADLRLVESDSLDTTLQAVEDNEDLDLVLLDLNMPGCGDLYGLIRVRKDYPDLPVAVVSATDSIDVISHVMNLGAKAFIPKSTASSDIAAAIGEVIEGSQWLPEALKGKLNRVTEEEQSVSARISALTPQQHKVLQFLQAGLLNKQIAGELNITEATVKAHIGAVFRKLEVNTRTQAVLLAEKLQVS